MHVVERGLHEWRSAALLIGFSTGDDELDTGVVPDGYTTFPDCLDFLREGVRDAYRPHAGANGPQWPEGLWGYELGDYWQLFASHLSSFQVQLAYTVAFTQRMNLTHLAALRRLSSVVGDVVDDMWMTLDDGESPQDFGQLCDYAVRENRVRIPLPFRTLPPIKRRLQEDFPDSFR